MSAARPATTPRSFRPPEVVLGVLLVAGCSLAAVLWQRHNDATETIVVAARPIPRGAAVTAADLGGAQMAGDVDALIAGDLAQSLLGQVAVVDIEAGAPITGQLLAGERPLGSDEALTSVALEAGEVPPDIAPGDRVRLVVTRAENPGGDPAARLLDAGATVWSVEQAQDGVSTVVTVRGPLALSTEIAAASAVRLARVEG